MKHDIRVRFAPSPTGDLHIGNVRAALLNYLFVCQKNGTSVLRIEDTDKERNRDESAYELMQDLSWLGLSFDEGPIVGGPYEPYVQSRRVDIYMKHIGDLYDMGHVYHCFCTESDLQKKREAQIARGEPPRYDRTCLNLSDAERDKKLNAGLPFLWRFKVDHAKIVTIETLERGTMTFELKHFSDFVLSRSDGSFTFLFTNFVDDWLMKITHVIRGEDHLSNTALQAALFDALAVKLPIFWHLPLLIGKDNKKLSKRDFGFSLTDLRHEGFLPEAIINYLALVGGSFSPEIQSLEELIQNYDFEHLHSTGPLHYDVEKLTWVNHQWMVKMSGEALLPHLLHIFYEKYPHHKDTSRDELQRLLTILKAECKTLQEFLEKIRFYFEKPVVDTSKIANNILMVVRDTLQKTNGQDQFLRVLKEKARSQALPLRDVFGAVRYIITGEFEGIGVSDLCVLLPYEEFCKRIHEVVC